MKKLSLPFVAVLIIFTNPNHINKTKKVNLRFEYQLSTYSKPQVENTANYARRNEESCGGFNKACQVTVDAANTLNGGSQLDPSKVFIFAYDYEPDGNFGIDFVATTTGNPSWDNKE